MLFVLITLIGGCHAHPIFLPEASAFFSGCYFDNRRADCASSRTGRRVQRASSLNAALAGKGRTLVYCSEGAPAGFDVAQYASSTDYTASGGTIYNQLVQYERGTTKLGPALAKRWKISPDGRVYTFILRHGVKFHTTPWFTPSR